jgi:hypothetical protein
MHANTRKKYASWVLLFESVNFDNFAQAAGPAAISIGDF